MKNQLEGILTIDQHIEVLNNSSPSMTTDLEQTGIIGHI